MGIFKVIYLIVIIQPLLCDSFQINFTVSEIASVDYTKTIPTANPIENSLFKILREDHQFHETLSTITNLNDMLRPFTDTRCLVHITSFKNVDMHPRNGLPIILRQLKPAILTTTFKDSSNQSATYNTLLWSLNNVEKLGKLQIYNDTFPCPHSKFFMVANCSKYSQLSARHYYLRHYL